MDVQKRPGWEWLVVILLFVFAASLLGMGLKQQQQLEREKALHYQLQVLRTAELLYKSVNKANPESLKQLAEGTFRLEGDERSHPFVDPPLMIKEGNVLDPFGNAYVYDPANGRIKSASPGHEFW